jgi:hypothetical protein
MSKTNSRVYAFAACVILAGGVLVVVWKSGIRGIRVETSKQHSPAEEYAAVGGNPLSSAIDRNVSDEEFKELVASNPKWVSYASAMHGQTNLYFSVLSECVMDRKTNYTKILISYGADVRASKTLFEAMDDKEAVAMLMQIQREVMTNNPSR